MYASKKRKKKKKFIPRLPIAKPGWAHKSKKDYNRKRDKKVPIDE